MPETNTIEATDHRQKTIESWLQRFFSNKNAPIGELFGEQSFWRDMVMFSWNIVTAEGQDEIAAMIAETGVTGQVSGWQFEGPIEDMHGIVGGWFSFETAIARGRGHVRLQGDKALTLFTLMTELKGHEERKGTRRPMHTSGPAGRNRQYWPQLRAKEEAALGASVQPYCLIIGGGQGGIILAARLRALNVPTLVVDRGTRPGEVWRERYKSLSLHDPVWLDQFPYMPFPETWPVFAPGEKMGEWLEIYTKAMDLNYWSSTECVSAEFDEAAQRWTVKLIRDGQPVTLTPTQVVVATGLHGTRKIPQIPGADSFAGEQYHASLHEGGDQYRGKNCVVIGSNTSAHDIAAALWENGANVTMIQRTPTIVVQQKTLLGQMTPLYSEQAVAHGVTADKADEIFASIPYRMLTEFQKGAVQEIKANDAEFYDKLQKSGFRIDFGEDESGLTMQAYRGGGFYIDVGASGLIADGEIKLQYQGIDHIEPDAVVLEDGTRLPADVIVYATGYTELTAPITRIFGQGVTDRIGRCFGMGSNTSFDPGPWEGEIRNLWKPLAQPNLWIMAGNLAMTRFYSRLVSLQIKARERGLNGAVYQRPIRENGTI